MEKDIYSNYITGYEDVVRKALSPYANQVNAGQVITKTQQKTPSQGIVDIFSPNVGGTAQTTPMTIGDITPSTIYNQPTTTATVTPPTSTGYNYKAVDGNTYNSVTGQLITPVTSFVPGETEEGKNLREASQAALNVTVDEDSIRRQQMQMFQQEIDALNAVYAIQKQEATQRGLGRLGSDAAIQARSGLLGSSFGSAQTEAVTGVNVAEQSAIDAERNAKISTIMGTMRKAVADEISEKRKAAQTSADALVTYLSGEKDRKDKIISDTVKNMISSDIDINDEQIISTAKELGIDVNTLKTQYNTAKKEAEAAQSKADLELKQVQSKLDTELAARIKSKADLSKPFAVGDEKYQYDQSTGDYISLGKTSTEKNYTSKDIPLEVKADLLATISANPKASFSDLADAFPEVDTKYLQEIIDSTK